ncbi:hypothetical protein BC829DRAFT_456332 [Chytridium lagenaria]|nr:hypothetical protein BC829DRAFT_456332 [Chytridium lagenaria]
MNATTVLPPHIDSDDFGDDEELTETDFFVDPLYPPPRVDHRNAAQDAKLSEYLAAAFFMEDLGERGGEGLAQRRGTTTPVRNRQRQRGARSSPATPTVQPRSLRRDEPSTPRPPHVYAIPSASTTTTTTTATTTTPPSPTTLVATLLGVMAVCLKLLLTVYIFALSYAVGIVIYGCGGVPGVVGAVAGGILGTGRAVVGVAGRADGCFVLILSDGFSLTFVFYRWNGSTISERRRPHPRPVPRRHTGTGSTPSPLRSPDRRRPREEGWADVDEEDDVVVGGWRMGEEEEEREGVHGRRGVDGRVVGQEEEEEMGRDGVGMLKRVRKLASRSSVLSRASSSVSYDSGYGEMGI